MAASSSVKVLLLPGAAKGLRAEGRRADGRRAAEGRSAEDGRRRAVE